MWGIRHPQVSAGVLNFLFSEHAYSGDSGPLASGFRLEEAASSALFFLPTLEEVLTQQPCRDVRNDRSDILKKTKV